MHRGVTYIIDDISNVIAQVMANAKEFFFLEKFSLNNLHKSSSTDKSSVRQMWRIVY
jgi:hypothetical protein